MTELTPPAAYLASLLSAVQEHLVLMVSAAADTSESEKELIMRWIERAVTRLAANMISQESARLAELMAHLGVLLGVLHAEEDPKEVA